MKIDIDVVAIVLAIVSFIASYATMRSTVAFMKDSVAQIQKDFKGMGSKLGDIRDKVIRHDALLESKDDSP